MNPSDYKPMCVEDFIGPARKVALIAERKCKELRAKGGKLKYLLHGPPGTGKTELAQFTARLLAGHELAVEEYNGKQINIEEVKAWMSNIRYACLFGDFTVKIINELDSASKDAQELLLTYLDKLPDGKAVIATSNLQLDLFPERVQTRWQHWKILNPSTEELTDWLCKRWKLPSDAASRIAVGSGGNIRAALLDTQSWMDLASVTP